MGQKSLSFSCQSFGRRVSCDAKCHVSPSCLGCWHGLVRTWGHQFSALSHLLRVVAGPCSKCLHSAEEQNFPADRHLFEESSRLDDSVLDSVLQELFFGSRPLQITVYSGAAISSPSAGRVSKTRCEFDFKQMPKLLGGNGRRESFRVSFISMGTAAAASRCQKCRDQLDFLCLG